ncbi:MAG: hypothetical protein AAB567_00370 [Patescibacteria group bacterium]
MKDFTRKEGYLARLWRTIREDHQRMGWGKDRLQKSSEKKSMFKWMTGQQAFQRVKGASHATPTQKNIAGLMVKNLDQRAYSPGITQKEFTEEILPEWEKFLGKDKAGRLAKGFGYENGTFNPYSEFGRKKIVTKEDFRRELSRVAHLDSDDKAVALHVGFGKDQRPELAKNRGVTEEEMLQIQPELQKNIGKYPTQGVNKVMGVSAEKKEQPSETGMKKGYEARPWHRNEGGQSRASFYRRNLERNNGQ